MEDIEKLKQMAKIGCPGGFVCNTCPARVLLCNQTGGAGYEEIKEWAENQINELNAKKLKIWKKMLDI